MVKQKKKYCVNGKSAGVSIADRCICICSVRADICSRK